MIHYALVIVIHTNNHYHHCESGGKSQQTQLFAGISHEPYQPVKNHTKPNE